jgi:hypothetical protein
MTQSHSQFVPELLPARRLHIGYLAAMKRSPQQPEDLNRRTTDTIRVVFALIFGFVSSIAVFPRASAQMIVPVDRTLRPPDRFEFSGQWNCADGVSIAYLEVEESDIVLPEGRHFICRNPGRRFVKVKMASTVTILSDMTGTRGSSS